MQGVKPYTNRNVKYYCKLYILWLMNWLMAIEPWVLITYWFKRKPVHVWCQIIHVLQDTVTYSQFSLEYKKPTSQNNCQIKTSVDI